MTDKGAICLGLAIVAGAGLIYLAAKTYSDVAVANAISANASSGVDVSSDRPRAPFGFDLTGAV